MIGIKSKQFKQMSSQNFFLGQKSLKINLSLNKINIWIKIEILLLTTFHDLGQSPMSLKTRIVQIIQTRLRYDNILCTTGI